MTHKELMEIAGKAHNLNVDDNQCIILIGLDNEGVAATFHGTTDMIGAALVTSAVQRDWFLSLLEDVVASAKAYKVTSSDELAN
jgi:hypothetical protein